MKMETSVPTLEAELDERGAKARNAKAPRNGGSASGETRPNRIPGLWLACGFTLLLSGMSFLPRATENASLAWSMRGAALALLALIAGVAWQAKRAGRTLVYEFAAKNVHYVQLMMHTCVYSYWGWYWRPVYHEVPLILSQIAFGYALDMLVCWMRRERWMFGFGPIPIVLSTNLFLWFRDDYYWLQFLLIAVGVLGKEFLKWKREGKMVHIFNPSALSLFLFSVVLIATGTTGVTWGIDISTTLHRPPHIYLEIFLLGLVVQGLFQVTLITLSAAGTLVLLGLIYTQMTGVYHFVDAGIPVSVFLGLHLLVTDPATSPKKYLGKFIFGALYGVGVFAAFGALTWFGAPGFYDKLLCVPILNLCVRRLDRFSERVSARLGTVAWKWNPRIANFAFMGVWVALFIVLTGTSFLAKGKDFPGGTAQFWKQACSEGKWKSCNVWTQALNAGCEDGARGDCLELGSVLNAGAIVKRNAEVAGVSFGRACDLGAPEGCQSLVKFVQRDGGKDVLEHSCGKGNGASCFILGSLYSEGVGVAQDGGQAFQLFEKSCATGWWRGCGRMGQSYLFGQGTKPDPASAVKYFDKACAGGNAASCAEVAVLYNRGVSGVQDHATAMQRLRRACDLGLTTACPPEERPANAGPATP